LGETLPLTGAVDISTSGTVTSNKQQFIEFFGDDFPALEKQLVLHLKRLPYHPPFADFPHYVATITLAKPAPDSRMANVFLSEGVARRWIQETLARRWIQETLEGLEEERRTGARIALSRHANRLAAERFASQWLQDR
jgi:hypothetical protein